jgi:hypothetical protein
VLAEYVDFIGSDAHRTNYRPSHLIRGMRELYKNYDKEYVDRIVYGGHIAGCRKGDGIGSELKRASIKGGVLLMYKSCVKSLNFMKIKVLRREKDQFVIKALLGDIFW